MECIGCQADDQHITLHKCPICFKWTCENCGHRNMGRLFCSPRCANQFFFSDDDDEE